MLRRELVKTLLAGTALAGAGTILASCNGQGGITIPTIPTVPVPGGLPTNVSTFLSGVNDVIGKINSLGSAVGSEVTALLGQATTLVGQITGGGDASSLGSTLLGVLGDVVPLLPPPYGTIGSAILTVLPTLASLVGAVLKPSASVRPRVAMSVDQAWGIIRSR